MDHVSAGLPSVTSTRIRGRRAVELRRARLAYEPLCRHCKERGIVRAATVPDHIVPLAFGGEEAEHNIQCLCDQCHAIKTAYESAGEAGADTHPEWLKPSAISLTIVCGPPCSGKTTYVEQHAGAKDLVIDFDTIARNIDPNYFHWRDNSNATLWRRTLRTRNELLGSLSRLASGKAWFIVSAPTQTEREWWCKMLDGEVILLNPGADECKRRAVQRGTPNAVNGVDKWFQKSRLPWHRKKRKQTIGLDGWPVE